MKRFSLVLVALILTLSTVLPVFAVEPEYLPEEGYVFQSVDDETGMIFAGIPKVRANPGDLIWSWDYAGSPDAGIPSQAKKAYLNRQSTNKRELVRWLTSVGHASEYTIERAETTTWTYDTGVDFDVSNKIRAKLGLSTSRTTSFKVGTKFPADASKASKLGFWSDQIYTYYRLDEYLGGYFVSSKNDCWIKTPGVETYIDVYYV